MILLGGSCVTEVNFQTNQCEINPHVDKLWMKSGRGRLRRKLYYKVYLLTCIYCSINTHQNYFIYLVMSRSSVEQCRHNYSTLSLFSFLYHSAQLRDTHGMTIKLLIEICLMLQNCGKSLKTFCPFKLSLWEIIVHMIADSMVAEFTAQMPLGYLNGNFVRWQNWL